MEAISDKTGIGEIDRSTGSPDGAADQIKWFHYIPVSRKAEWEALGWHVVDEFQDLHHGRHGVLAQWQGGGEPVIP